MDLILDFDIVCVVMCLFVDFVVGNLISICKFRCWFGLRFMLCSDFVYDLDSGSELYFGNFILNWILNWFCLFLDFG